MKLSSFIVDRLIVHVLVEMVLNDLSSMKVWDISILGKEI